MRCPYCKSGIVEFGADGHIYCPECMRRVENGKFAVLSERIINRLDEFYEAVDVDEQELALECVQNWLYQKGGMY